MIFETETFVIRSSRLFRSISAFAAAIVCAGPAPVPAAKPVPLIAFEPRSFYMLSSAFDFMGSLTYLAKAGVVPKPVPPSNGYLTCTGGYSVDLQVSAGPYNRGAVEDRFVVLPHSISPPRGTLLKCTSTWGLYGNAGKTLLGSTTLYATINYDTGTPPIAFEPAAVTLKAGGPVYTGKLAYYNSRGARIRSVANDGQPLSCTNGTVVPFAVKAGPVVGDAVDDTYTIDPANVTVPKGTSLACSSLWGSYAPNGTLLGEARLEVQISN